MRLTVVGLLIAGTLSSLACHAMRPVTFDQLGALRPSQAWVTRADQTTVIVSGPQTFGDTLVGYVNGQFEEIPAATLQKIVVRRRSSGKTAALLVGGALGVAAIAYMVSSSGLFNDPQALLDCEDDPYQPGCPLAP